MFAVIDSGTTNSRIYLVDEQRNIVASSSKKVGVRDTAITGSRETLRSGLKELFFELLAQEGVDEKEVKFAIASGMITSEIGLMELPHLTAPVGLCELSQHIYKCTDPNVLPIPCPLYFVRGVRNCYRKDAQITDLCDIDFMRGEEVQCIGIMEQLHPSLPCTIVVLSSHTKIIFCDENKKIVSSKTTLSGQLREALLEATNIGKSLESEPGEEAYGYSLETLVDTAYDCVGRDGIIRALLMPRFMQVLLKTDAWERKVFTDAIIAADDMKAFFAMKAQGYLANTIILFGHETRCHMYKNLLQKKVGVTGEILEIYDKSTIGKLTVDGAIAVAEKIIEKED